MRFYDREQKDEISIGALKQKAEAFLGATHQFKGYEISFKGLSVEDM